MGKLNLFFIPFGVLFAIAFPVQGATPAGISSPCDSLFDFQSTIAQLRQEIMQAHLKYQKSGRPEALGSNFIEGRALDILPPQVSEGQVVSLGSGPDIFLPLYQFPNAPVFRLIDSLRGWGQGADHLLEEIEMRLKALAPNAEFRRLDNQGDWRKIEDSLKGPLIWEVTWTSPSLGPMKKIFMMHQGDYNDLQAMAQIQIQPLIGLVMTGAAGPWETYQFFIDQLMPEGFMLTELFSTQGIELVERMKERYQMVDHGEVVPLKGIPNLPRRFEIRFK
ncbi:MAG: hypothetical protein AB7N80_07725 [Bdellovibrionales bacterium]